MVNKEILDYIKQQFEQSVDAGTVKNSLLSSGWKERDIDEALFVVFSDPFNTQASNINVPTIKKLPGSFTILSQAWALFRKRVGALSGVLVATILVPAFLFGAGFLILMLGGSFLSAKAGLMAFVLMALLGIVFFSLLIFLVSWGQAAMVVAIRDSQEQIGVKESFRRSWVKLRSFIWLTILLFVVYYLGIAMLLIPALLFMVWFGFSSLIMINEGFKGTSALMKSRAYVKGYFWGVIWRIIFIYLLFFVLVLFINTLVAILGLTVIMTPISLIISFLSPVISVYMFYLYSYLKRLNGDIVIDTSLKSRAMFIFTNVFSFLAIPIILVLILFIVRRLLA